MGRHVDASSEAGSSDAVPTSSPARWQEMLPGLWPLALAMVLLLPLRHTGYPLARDLVFVPHEPLTDASIGLGGTSPRAVPLDAVVAVLTSVVDGAVVARVMLLLTLAVAGWGVLRLTAPLGTAARLAASGLAVWNPFVVERMMLGQWALVAAYGATPWILLSAARFRRTGDRSALASVVLWSGVASLTPTGGLLAVAAMLAGGATRGRRTCWLLAAGVLGQLPWLVPSLVGGAATTSDPAGVAAFSPGSDGSGSPALALVGMGGIWDGLSIPSSRHTWLAAAAVVFVVLVVAVGATPWWRSAGELAPRLLGLGLGGLVLALALSTSPGQAVLRSAVVHLPGAGLLRDGQKLLAPFVVLVACLFGAAVDLVVRRLTRLGGEVAVPVALLLALLPLLLLPDGAGAVWGTVRPVRYPAHLLRVADTVNASPESRGVVTLPWRSYRNFSWGTGTTSSDPLVRMLDRPVFTSDDLQVGHVVVPGESPSAARLGAALAGGTPSHVLPGFGIGWVVVYADDPAAHDLDLTGLRRVSAAHDVALYAVPNASAVASPAAWRRDAVVAADLFALLAWVTAVLIRLVGRRMRGVLTPGSPVLESPQPPREESR